ncbi:MAG TPA: hypothetical protein VFY65_11900 [Longimicrobium sp.]|nr:hypothetical protein [Longimicrobium sp.]
MRAPRWLSLLVLAAVALCAGGARAQAMATTGACPPGTDADACYRQGLTLADSALDPPVDEAGVRQALRVLLGACEQQIGDACYVAGRITAADTAAVTTRAALASAAGRAAVLFAHGCYATGRPSAAACNALGFASAYALEAATPDSALDHLERGCENGNPTACVRAARLIDDWPAAAARTSTRPAQLAARACEGGSPGGCVQVARRASARLAHAPAAPASRGERAAVRAHLRDACARGLATACTELGATYLPGDPVFRANVDSAAFYLEMACTGEGGLWAGKPPRLGDGAGCARMGRVLAAFVSAPGLRPATDTLAFSFMEMVCSGEGRLWTGPPPRAGDGDACARMGRTQDPGATDSAAVARAMDWFRRGCELVDSDSCADLAYYGTLHEQVPLPLAQLRAVTACNEDSGYGCWVAGWLYRQPALLDDAQADRYLRRACRLDYGPGCTEMGDVPVTNPVPRCRGECTEGDRGLAELLESLGIDHHYDPLKYFRRGCALGDAAGCSRFAAALRNIGDEPRSVVFSRRACEYGDAQACWDLMQIARSVPDEVAEGTLRTRACRADPTFCKRKD